ncbi:MAG TPA: phage Gp37/Gp68 family protein [Bosea sp. (in: a-proteobacteria)]|jgi:protein gp37|nr:phage Gp37/Gp68 family protein [Bosea sp. (in: a-proteobacteria)]
MAETSIEWTERSWNPIVGCTIVSPGCTNCYAMGMADRFKDVYRGRKWAGMPAEAMTRRVNGKAVWTGHLTLAPDHILTEPLRRRKPTTYFVNSMGDLFHEDTPEEWIDLVIAIMALCPQHTFQILTKRGERMRKHMSPTTSIPMLGRLPLERVHIAAAGDIEGENGLFEALKRYGNLYSLYCSVPWPLPNVWLGISAEDQRHADERVHELLATPAAVRFVSNEPALGPVDYTRLQLAYGRWLNALTGELWTPGHAGENSFTTRGPKLDWIIVGGESGRDARPMHPDWPRRIRDACVSSGTAFFFKQWGDYLPAGQTMANGRPWNPGCGSSLRGTKAIVGRFLDGVEHNAMPEAHR